jgi:hypothetical protein
MFLFFFFVFSFSFVIFSSLIANIMMKKFETAVKAKSIDIRLAAGLGFGHVGQPDPIQS